MYRSGDEEMWRCVDVPVLLRVIPLQLVDMKILNKHVKGK